MSAKTDLEKFVRNLRRGVGVSVAKTSMTLLGKEMIRLIVIRTRNGFGVKRTGAKSKRLKRLSERYIDLRKKSKLDTTTTSGRSNLTFTGQLLRSMVVKKVSNRKLTIGPNRRRRKGGITNEELGEFVTEQGRPFNNLSASQIDSMVRFIDKNLQKVVDKLTK